MKSITQSEINEEYPEIIKNIDDESIRVKTWANENGHHAGTAVYGIVRKYRNELKDLRNLLRCNIDE